MKTKTLSARIKAESDMIGDFTVSPDDFTKGEIYLKDLEAWGVNHCK